MNPEMMNCLIGLCAAVVGYFLRHKGISLPGLSIPTPQPAVAPASGHPVAAVTAQAAAVADPIVQQLLAHQLELIQQLKAVNATWEPAPSAAPSAPAAR